MKHVQIKVEGRVQGVFFRASVVNEAKSLGLKGWVRNLDDGSVLISAEGEDPSIKKLEEWCWKGPQFASVKNVIMEEKELKGFNTFEVQH